MKLNITKKTRGFTLVELLVVIGIIVVLAGMATPGVMKGLKRAKLTASVANSKQIKAALDNFAIDFDGSYVDEENGEKVSENGMTSTTEAYGFYNALIDARALDRADEGIFYSKELEVAVTSHTEGDGADTLEDNETGYSYVVGLSNTSTGPAPIVCTKLDQDTGVFYDTVWDGKAVIVRVNGSAAAEVLTRSNKEFEETVRGETNTNVFDWATSNDDGDFLDNVFIAQ